MIHLYIHLLPKRNQLLDRRRAPKVCGDKNGLLS